MNVGLCKVSDFCGCARGVAAAFLLLLSILTVGVKTGAGGVGWKLGAFDEKAPAFGGKRGAVGEKAGGYFFRMLVNCAISSFSFEISSSLG